jgi:molybdate transport system substrate-binding protein
MLNHLRRVAASVLALLLLPAAASAQVKSIVSGGFRAAYTAALPEFERTSGITVTTGSGASRGMGRIRSALNLRAALPPTSSSWRRKDWRIWRPLAGPCLAPWSISRARPSGSPCRPARPGPTSVRSMHSSVHSSRRERWPFVDSTVGIYLRTKLFPQLGVAEQVAGKLSTGGVTAVAAGEADFTIQPLSELTNVKGIEVVGTIPAEIQYISVFSAAVVKGAAQPDAGQKLIDFLASDKARAAITNSGMEPIGRR